MCSLDTRVVLLLGHHNYSKSTVRVDSLPHRKWKQIKQQPSMLPGPAVPGCCWISLHFLWGKLSTRTVVFMELTFLLLYMLTWEWIYSTPERICPKTTMFLARSTASHPPQLEEELRASSQSLGRDGQDQRSRSEVWSRSPKRSRSLTVTSKI